MRKEDQGKDDDERANDMILCETKQKRDTDGQKELRHKQVKLEVRQIK